MYGAKMRAIGRLSRSLPTVVASVCHTPPPRLQRGVHSLVLSSVRSSVHVLSWRGGRSVVSFSQLAAPQSDLQDPTMSTTPPLTTNGDRCGDSRLDGRSEAPGPSGFTQREEMVNQGKEAIKITRVGMYVNLGMTLSKGVVGVASSSSALIADAAHSLSDLLSDFVTLWSVRVARLPPDPKHPYGYGKYEAVGSLSVGAILVLCGAGIGMDGFQSFQDLWGSAGDVAQAVPQLSLPFVGDLDRNSQLALAAGAAGVSIVAKEALYHATVRIGERIQSKVLVANAWHHRTDAISSIVALGGILGSIAGMPLLDPAAGIAVSAMIMKTGAEICMDSVRELTDKSVEAEVLEVLNEVSRNVDDVRLVSNIRARRMGPYTLVDLRVHVHARTSISMAQQIAARVRSHILQQMRDVSEVLVHIDVDFAPEDRSRESAKQLIEQEMRPYREIKAHVSGALATIPEITGTTHINTHWVPYKNGSGTVVDVAIFVKPDLKVGEAHEVAKRARKAIEAISYVAEADIHLELHDSDSDQP